MPDEYLYRADWPHRWRRRSGLRRDRDVDKMPKEMLIWYKETLKSEKGYKSRPNDRFGFNNWRLLSQSKSPSLEITPIAFSKDSSSIDV